MMITMDISLTTQYFKRAYIEPANETIEKRFMASLSYDLWKLVLVGAVFAEKMKGVMIVIEG